MKSNPLILGAGPAGLACAHELCANGIQPLVMDKNEQAGGLCRTLEFEGSLFDIGGHRFISKSREVNELWRRILGPDLLLVKRKSRIYYRDRFFNYPLNLLNATTTLGFTESVRCLASYLFSRWSKAGDDSHFEGWMTRRFGKRLYEIFFKTYTEKVWGIPCRELSSDWAVQRIQSLSLGKAVLKAFGSFGPTPKTLSEEFLYPRLGPGLFCDRWKNLCEESGTEFLMNCRAEEIRREGNRITEVTAAGPGGELRVNPVSHLFSSIPITLLIQKMKPLPPPEVLEASRQLKFRSFMVVNLIFDQKNIFPDNWIYVHSPGIRAGRIQNYKNWSMEMVSNPDWTTLGVEYFVNEGEGLWNFSNEDMIQLALMELEEMGLVAPARYVKGFVVKIANVYPVYSPEYQKHLNTIRNFVENIENLSLMGREGLFRYDNSDHAILTGLYAARNYMGKNPQDVWSVNTEKAHLEEWTAESA